VGCLGLIVDDTIHILYCKLSLRKGIEELSYGLLTTSLILAGGFALFALSNFEPTQIFGSLSATVFLITFISDMIILNWLLKK